jgi:hypothetical protein
MQTQIAFSTMEAEYIDLSQSMRDLIPIREILKEIMLEVLNEKFKPECTTHSKAFVDATPSPNDIIPQSELFEDSSACLKFAQIPKLPPRTKYIAVPLHWWRSKVINLEIVIRPVSSVSQIGDQFAKGLGKEPFEPIRMSLMGW